MHSQRNLVYVPRAFDQAVYGAGWAWDDAGAYFQRSIDVFPVDENEDLQSFEPLSDSLVIRRLSQVLDRPVYLSENFFPPYPKVLRSVAADSVCKQLLQQSDNFVAEQLMF